MNSFHFQLPSYEYTLECKYIVLLTVFLNVVPVFPEHDQETFSKVWNLDNQVFLYNHK